MASPKQYPDSQWLEELSKDNADAFKDIYEAYQHPLFAFAFYLTKSKDIAAEVVQEVFIHLWEKRVRFHPDILLLPYLKKMTQNLVFDLFKKANRDRSLQQRLYNSMVKASRDSLDVLWEKELNLAYYEAIQQLPPRQKLIYSLHRNQDLTYLQIADQLGLSHNTVRNHMMEAIRSVRLYVANHADLAGIILAICFLEINP